MQSNTPSTSSTLPVRAVLIVCGYRRTGKDTLYQQLAGISSYPWTWQVYGQEGTTLDLSSCSTVLRRAYADALKEEVREAYCIPADFDYERRKDEKLFRDGAGEPFSARDALIAWGAKRRGEDPDYWCRPIYRDVEAKEGGALLVVTDWRFPNEYRFPLQHFSSSSLESVVCPPVVNIVTARVYSPEVPVPDAGIESEHALNEVKTDFLLVRGGEGGNAFLAAVERFPQYREYKRVEMHLP